MDVLLIYPYLPHPDVSHGSGRLLVPLLRLWRDQVRITLVCGYRPHEARHLEAARALVHGFHPVLRPLRSDRSALGRVAETARTAFRTFTRGEPIHAIKLDRSVFHDAIRQALSRTRFDVAQIEMAGFARYVADLGALPSVLVDHEAGVASGGDLASDPRSLRYIRKFYPRFARVVALCREDAAELGAALPGVSVGLRRPGVAAPEAKPTAPPARGGVLFFGSAEHTPNQDALAWLATDLWPRIARQAPGARCVAAGGSVSPQLARLLAAAGIENKGFVPDIAAELAGAGAVVAPVRSGRGVRMKCLDALAAGCPLVTTRLGAHGLDLRDGEHARITDGAADFSDAVAALLRDPARASQMGAAGRVHVLRSFTQESAASSNLDVWKTLVSA